MTVVDQFELCGTKVAGSYLVEAVVAEGGFGLVYQAHHTGFLAPVALKCLKVPQSLPAEQQSAFRAQFQAEAQLLFKLSVACNHVVRPLHVDAIVAPNGCFMPFMVLEWLDGQTLEKYALEHRQGAPDAWLRELVTLLTPAAEALALAHAFPGEDGPIAITHCDIKPENLFVAQVAGQPVIKVLDFGIAKARSVASLAAGERTQSSGGLVAFSPAYAAPEQWVPQRLGQTGPWTDVWGLALALMELLVGEPVLVGDAGELMGAALDPYRRPTPETFELSLAPGVERVFARALQVDPRDRYQSLTEFWDDLRQSVGLAVERRAPEAPRDPVGELTFDDIACRQPSGFPSLLPTNSPAMLALGATPPPARPEPQPSAPNNDAALPPRAAPAPDGEAVRVVSLDSHVAPLWHQCVVPGVLIACGTGLSVLGELYAKRTGSVFSLASVVPLSWITAAMVLMGCAALVFRLLGRGQPGKAS